jgi:hypothetical protein
MDSAVILLQEGILLGNAILRIAVPRLFLMHWNGVPGCQLRSRVGLPVV